MEGKNIKIGLIRESCEEPYIKIFIERSEDKCDYIVGIKCTGLSDAQK